MKKNCLTLSVLAIICILAACSAKAADTVSSENTTFDSEETTLTEEPSQVENPYPYLNGDDIVFIKTYVNYAEGYQYRANYVTANGNEYCYEYHVNMYNVEGYGIDDVFSFPLDDVVNTYSTKQMTEMLYNLSKVENIEFEKEQFAFDFGAYTVYGVIYNDKGDKNVMELGTFGDYHLIPNDENAKKICNFMGIKWD